MKGKKQKASFCRAFVLKLEPDEDQARLMARYAGIARKTWNLLLEYVDAEHKENKKYPGKFQLIKQCAGLKKEDGLEYLTIAPAQVL